MSASAEFQLKDISQKRHPLVSKPRTASFICLKKKADVTEMSFVRSYLNQQTPSMCADVAQDLKVISSPLQADEEYAGYFYLLPL